MLGKSPSCPVKKWYEEHFYPYTMEEADDGRGGIQVSVPGGGGFDSLNYTAEALIGQILAHARGLAEAMAEETVKESVITVRAQRTWAESTLLRLLGRRYRRSGAKTSAKQSWMLLN